MLRSWAPSSGIGGPRLCRIHSAWRIYSAYPPFPLSLRVSSLVTLRIFLAEMEELLLTNKPPIPQTPVASIKGNKKPAGPPPYDRTQYYSYAQGRDAAFGKLYSALFTIAKAGQSRNIDIEVCPNNAPSLVLGVYSIFRLEKHSGLCCSSVSIRLSRKLSNILRSVPMCTTRVHMKLIICLGEGNL